MTDLQVDLYAAGWSAPSSADLDPYEPDPHAGCAEFCVATHKPGVCKGTKHGGQQAQTAVVTPPKPIALPKTVTVPNAPTDLTPQQAAAQQARTVSYQQAQLHAQRLAQQLGGSNWRQAHGAVLDYGHALHQHQQALNHAAMLNKQAHAAHDRAVAQNANAQTRYAAAVARQRAAAATKATKATASTHQTARQKLMNQLTALQQKAHAAQKTKPVVASGEPALYAVAADMEALAYGLLAGAHLWCDIGAFCRNPLHPGPCKGWKHTLKQVAPELHRQMEEARQSRRPARVAKVEPTPVVPVVEAVKKAAPVKRAPRVAPSPEKARPSVAPWKPPKPISAARATAMQKEMLGGKTWTPDELAALTRYSSTDFADINGVLRGSLRVEDIPEKGFGGASVQDTIRHADAAMRPLPEGVPLLRRVGFEAFGVENADDLRGLVGHTLQDRGFLSTTIVRRGQLDKAVAAQRSVVMEIDAPAGTPAAYVGDIAIWRQQKEMILAPGTKYQVVEVVDGDVTTVRVRVVP